MRLLAIGEFSRLTMLSAKALRLYDQLGLVVPARVDASSGYRWYREDQAESARLVGLLRRIGMPLAQIPAIVAAGPDQAANAIASYQAGQEALAGERRALARYLIGNLKGQEHAVYQIEVHQIPDRKLLTMTRHVHAGEVEAFVGQARAALLTVAPRLPGYAGAPFMTYYGEVSQDSDGPVEFCRPVAPATPDEDLQLEGAQIRSEPAHEDISVRIAPDSTWPQALPAFDALTAWAAQRHREPRPGIRQVFIVDIRAAPPKLIGIDLTLSLK